MELARETTLTVNGTKVTRRIEPRLHLVDFLREELGLTGSHLGCEHGVCGACTVRVIVASSRSPVMSTSSSGEARRMLSAGIRLWPPARIFAPGRAASSNASASDVAFA